MIYLKSSILFRSQEIAYQQQQQQQHDIGYGLNVLRENRLMLQTFPHLTI